MSYELVHLRNRFDKEDRSFKRSGKETDDETEWDLPPDDWRTFAVQHPHDSSARQADVDAQNAHQRGDESFAKQRETDAAEHRQHPWDMGDLRTWAILFLMFFGFLAFVAFVYWMPQGRSASPPSIRLY